MKYLLTITLFCVSCGGVEVKAPEQEKSEIDLTDGESEEAESEGAESQEPTELSGEQDTDVNVSVDVDVNVSVNTRGSKSAETFHLENINPTMDTFVSDNYCKGSHIHNCWLKSGVARRFEDGSFYISLEFWDDSKEMPYTVTAEVIDDDYSFMLTTDGKILADQDSINFRPVWGVMSLSDMTLTTYYDYEINGVGLSGQGDEELETLRWIAD